MARVKLQTPPIFYGKPHEDALDWIDCYETIGAFNGWRDADLRKFLIIHLDGPARQWYLRNADTIPEHWKKREGEVVQGQRTPDQEGACEIFLKEFQKGTNETYICSDCGQPGHIKRFWPPDKGPLWAKGKIGDKFSSGKGPTDQKALE